MVKKVTHSSALVGYVGALEALPYLLFGAYAGVVADRFDRRKVMLLSDMASGATLFAFAACTFLWVTPPVWSLLVTPFLLSTIRCFFMPAKSASIPSLVPDALLVKANALSSGTQTIAGLVSLSISAGVLGAVYEFSPRWFYTSSISINAVSFLLSAAFIFRLPRILPDRDHALPPNPVQDFKDGLVYIKSRHDLKVLTVLLTIFRLMVAPFFVVYLAANDKWFGGKPQTIIWLEVAFMAGMLLSTVVMGHIRTKRPLVWFASGLALCGFTIVMMSYRPTLLSFGFWQFVAGLAIPPADIPVVTFLQLSVPDQFRGRVNSVREMISMGVMPVGMVFGGVLVERLGLEATFIVMGIGMIGACGYGMTDKRYRRAKMPDGQVVAAV